MNHEKHWLSELQGKTLKGVRPIHDNGPVPDVRLMLTDGTTYIVSVPDGVYFEACLINTLRRAQPVHDVIVTTKGNDTKIDVRSKTFPMLTLRATVKSGDKDLFPFSLVKADA